VGATKCPQDACGNVNKMKYYKVIFFENNTLIIVQNVIGLGFCPVIGFDIIIVEPSSSTAKQLIGKPMVVSFDQ
jgi:hypothetical protein